MKKIVIFEKKDRKTFKSDDIHSAMNWSNKQYENLMNCDADLILEETENGHYKVIKNRNGNFNITIDSIDSLLNTDGVIEAGFEKIYDHPLCEHKNKRPEPIMINKFMADKILSYQACDFIQKFCNSFDIDTRHTRLIELYLNLLRHNGNLNILNQIEKYVYDKTGKDILDYYKFEKEHAERYLWKKHTNDIVYTDKYGNETKRIKPEFHKNADTCRCSSCNHTFPEFPNIEVGRAWAYPDFDQYKEEDLYKKIANIEYNKPFDRTFDDYCEMVKDVLKKEYNKIINKNKTTDKYTIYNFLEQSQGFWLDRCKTSEYDFLTDVTDFLCTKYNSKDRWKNENIYMLIILLQENYNHFSEKYFFGEYIDNVKFLFDTMIKWVREELY